MIKRVIILGGGSAGFVAALTLKSELRDLQVMVIRFKDIGIIGVGEGSTLPFGGIVGKRRIWLEQRNWLRFIVKTVPACGSG